MNTINICYLGRMDYGQTLDIQYQLLELRQNDQIGDTILLVEHPPVLTLGTRTDRSNIYLPEEELKRLGVTCYDVNRGGDVTYHGPGQLVVYPIMRIEQFPGSVRGYVTSLEQSLIRLMHDEFGIRAERRQDKYTGVWVGEEKIVAIGIAVKKWVTMHGYAFNINTDLSHFNWINPCGLSMGVTSVEKLTGKKADFDRICRRAADYLVEELGATAVEVHLEDLQ